MLPFRKAPAPVTLLSAAPLMVGMWAVGSPASPPAPASRAGQPLQLDVADDGKQIKLLVRHAAIGLICELWCYEGGPFRYGTATRREDGSVLFVHTARQMTATTTFTPRGNDRVAMEIRVEGPLDELKQVRFMGPCMQFWHSEAFQRRENLVEFAGRCFLYTVRGPVGLLDTGRGRMKSFPADAPENNPPCTQWYVPIDASHPGDIWGFGASGDRPLYGVVGVSSRDGKWLAAIGTAYTNTLGQGWHDCIHHVPTLQVDLDERASRISHRTMLYVMPNDQRKLLENFRRDCPRPADEAAIAVSVAENGALRVKSRGQGTPALDVTLDVAGTDDRPGQSRRPAWKASPWGGFVRDGGSWRMWAYPSGQALELWASLAEGSSPARVKATLAGKGWAVIPGKPEVPAVVRQSSDGTAIAAWAWEDSEPGQPAIGVPAPGAGSAAGVSVCGRLSLGDGGVEALPALWAQTKQQWAHARPYRMPVEQAGEPPRQEGRVRR